MWLFVASMAATNGVERKRKSWCLSRFKRPPIILSYLSAADLLRPPRRYSDNTRRHGGGDQQKREKIKTFLLWSTVVCPSKGRGPVWKTVWCMLCVMWKLALSIEGVQHNREWLLVPKMALTKTYSSNSDLPFFYIFNQNISFLWISVEKTTLLQIKCMPIFSPCFTYFRDEFFFPKKVFDFFFSMMTIWLATLSLN